MTRNLEALKDAYKATTELASVSQTVEGRSEDKKRERRIYYRGEQEGIKFSALCVLSKKEYQEFVLYTIQ